MLAAAYTSIAGDIRKARRSGISSVSISGGALAAAEQAQQLGLEPDSEELRDALAFVDAQLFDVVMRAKVDQAQVKGALGKLPVKR